MVSLLVGLLATIAGASPALAKSESTGAVVAAENKIPTPEELEASGAVIGQIIFDKKNVFDPTQPSENKSLFRLANRLHFVTRDSTIRQQLLVKPGDVYSKRLLDESERLLRSNSYLFDAKITPFHYENGVVDLQIWTRDVWSLSPEISVSRSGGENRSRISIGEQNFLGTGIAVKLSYNNDVDRNSTAIQYFDRNVGNSWASLYFLVADKSDGDTTQVNLSRPFYSLDSRWSAGVGFLDDTRVVSFYDLGDEVAEYAVDSKYHSVYGGWSSGLSGGWVRRWTVGLVNDEDDFETVTDGTLPSLIPDDRLLVYPFIGFELLQDEFQTTRNHDQIGRTEDFYVGTRLAGSLGWADKSFGSDRNSLVYSASMSTGFGAIKKKALFLSSWVDGRVDNGSSANSRYGVKARYYNSISSKRLFFMTLGAEAGNNLDLDSFFDLGGDSGLRGYPLRYQTGDARALFTIEQRYFTDWYPFRMIRVGAAMFADVGRTWGDNPAGGPSSGWLTDVGFGLRFARTRASGRHVIHIDIAFPLDGDPSIDSVQVLVQTKRGF